ncbi:hypothetical protein NDU88_000233 [Pleurodeles waltl]|uniref:Uncharacterized protein n=1 Tax=Pleurodeles waltl TaxID=8319 RepID=A0AAV7S6H5_PLEWA|nr:hypothetical protein NDU88_000233 [Pleurodeles waltl]
MVQVRATSSSLEALNTAAGEQQTRLDTRGEFDMVPVRNNQKNLECNRNSGPCFHLQALKCNSRLSVRR